MNKKFILILSISIIFVAIAAKFYFGQNKSNNLKWRTTKAKKGNITIVVKSTGTINADTTVQVGTQVTGTIWKLYADYNSVVKQGQIIAILDTTFLSAARQDAQANLDKAQSQYSQAKRDYDRTKKLAEEKVMAQTDYENSLTNLESSKAAVTSAKSQLNRALINLQYAVIKAPVSGVVISRSVELGQTVVSSFNTPTLFTIVNDLTKMQVQANVDEADIGQVQIGQEVSFTVDAYPDELFSGEIAQVRLQPVTVQNVVNYIVIINVSNKEMKLKPGLTANINIKVSEHKDVIKIPANAINFVPPAEYIAKSSLPDSIKNKLKKESSQTSNDDNQKSKKSSLIWIKKGNDIIPKKIEIGISDGSFIEISGDIKIDDEVVLGQDNGVDKNAAAPKSPFMPQFPGKK